MNDYKHMTTRELQKLYHEKALKANAKLKELGELRQYNNVMARKYEPLLNDTTKNYMHTKARVLKSGLVISPKFKTSIPYCFKSSGKTRILPFVKSEATSFNASFGKSPKE